VAWQNPAAMNQPARLAPFSVLSDDTIMRLAQEGRHRDRPGGREHGAACLAGHREPLRWGWPTGEKMSTKTQSTGQAAPNGAGAQQTLTIADNRTGRSYELPIVDGTVRGMDLRQIKTSEEDFGLMVYDPGYANVASCRSSITYLDGEQGILQYRGYPIEQLAEHST
jgi:hypothetical protein